MPVDVTMEEPWSSVVCVEAQSHIIASALTDVDGVAPDGILKIIRWSAGDFHNVEGMLHKC